ncbi:MAG: hypothetical protein KC478_15505 [Bacteriovoracaceae bacterium]|nr:hypothetical protein [Bacteriovoracaceae bacterium]
MHKQMYALVPGGSSSHVMEIFGYSTKGIPGVEIVGLGAKGKSIKEKFIFLNKKLEFKIPARRYVLCVEDSLFSTSKDDLYRWLELPFLIMYWSMANILPIQNLDNCLCGGKITARGKISSELFSDGPNSEVLEYLESGLKLITANSAMYKDEQVIPLKEVMGRNDLVIENV